MFANPTNVGISQRVVATLVACAVMLASIGLYTHHAQAANLTFISDTLSDSAPGAMPAHTIAFTLPATSAGLANGDTTTITLESFTIGALLASGDITVRVNTVIDAHAGFSTTTNSFSFNSVAASAGDDIEVAITSNNLTNPAVGSYDVSISTGTGGDTGKTMIAIVDTVSVEAIVDTTFTFIVEGLATSTAIDSATTTGSTTATLIDFGQLTAGVSEILGQRLNVITNAKNGFDVTVESDSDLSSANGADIDSFSMGTDVSTPTAWSDPVSNISNENTWGHWGVTTEDNTGLFDAGEYIAVSSTTARSLFSHNGPADGAEVDMGETDVAYKIRITPLQEAADDYQTTLTYVATPTF